MELQYEQSTSKEMLPSRMDRRNLSPAYDNAPLEAPHVADDQGDFSKPELRKLLAVLEGELQARDEIIERLNGDLVRMQQLEARYGRADPLLALGRDARAVSSRDGVGGVGSAYAKQLAQLERLIHVQRTSHEKASQVLSSTERRHARALRELEAARERESRHAAHGDDVVAFLENERTRLEKHLEYQINEVGNCKKEIGKLEKRLEAEAEKHKAMILFLVNDRKQTLLKMHELRVKNEQVVPVASSGETALVDELRKELAAVRTERDQLRAQSKSAAAEALGLKELLRARDADIMTLRRNAMAGSKLPVAAPVSDDRSLVMGNRMATSATPPQTTPTGAGGVVGGAKVRLSTSSSFPAEKSRLPRAPSSPGRPRVQLSPTKRTPAMGLNAAGAASAGAAAAAPPRRSTAPVSSPAADPELQQLEAAIQSMNKAAAALPDSPTKRSSSLPRGKSEPRRVDQAGAAAPPQGQVVYKTEPRPATSNGVVVGANVAPTASVARPSTASSSASRLEPRKLSATLKKNGSGLLKAFGKS